MKRVGKELFGRDTSLFPIMMKQKPRKPKRKDTQVPQPGGPTTNVADEAVNEEMDDSLVRAATTASSLEAEQDSGGGPRCQETMGDTIARTRFENVFKTSNDSLLARGNTPQSDEDRLKLNELMEFCTKLQQRVLDLENTKTAQAQEITSLKLRVKKLEKKGGLRTRKLKRLYKVGLSRRVESSDEEGINLVSTHFDADTYMFIVHDLVGDEVIVEIKVASKDEQAHTTIVSSQQPSQLNVQYKGKGKMVEPEHVKKLSKKDQLMLDEELAFKLQAE
ncbi:hypothetical protein Tco_1069291 [Tanacetum coccineum]|uniref:Uncharacterized protein n=1 Tax=Tanacetum coccineum TaxID=301880 RepID=A0ABQ5HJ86_9ASTR